MSMENKRDLIGYGRNRPKVPWPNHAKIAINFVINYEEGAELTPYNHDASAEIYGGEFPLSTRPDGIRNYSMESLFEYGSRAGLWRLLKLFDEAQLPLTFFITGFALTLNPEFSAYLRESDHEIAGHGWRWIDYALVGREFEKKHIQQTIKTLKQLTGKNPQGWYTGRRSEYTRELLIENGTFLYDSDSYADDYPYFIDKQLIIPYSLICNDFRFGTSPGYSSPEDFYNQLISTFNFLYQENQNGLMSIGLHPRFSGHPGRCYALLRFIEFIQKYNDIWITRRIDIAHHWRAAMPNSSPDIV